MHFHKYPRNEEMAVGLSFFSVFFFRLAQHFLTARSQCYNYYYQWSSSEWKERGERERERERERKKCTLWLVREYLPILEIYPLWFDQPTQEFWYHQCDEERNRDKREEIRAISFRRSFSPRTPKKRVYITTCYPRRQSFSTSRTRRVPPIIR
jgi:hypothetical protein